MLTEWQDHHIFIFLLTIKQAVESVSGYLCIIRVDMTKDTTKMDKHVSHASFV